MLKVLMALFFGDFVANFAVPYMYDKSHPLSFKTIDILMKSRNDVDNVAILYEDSLKEIDNWHTRSKEPVCKYRGFPNYFPHRTFIYREEGVDIAVVNFYDDESFPHLQNRYSHEKVFLRVSEGLKMYLRKTSGAHQCYDDVINSLHCSEFAHEPFKRKETVIHDDHLKFITRDLTDLKCSTAFDEFVRLLDNGWTVKTDDGTVLTTDLALKRGRELNGQLEQSLTSSKKSKLEDFDKAVASIRSMYIDVLLNSNE